MSACVIADTPVGFLTWARPGPWNNSTAARSAPHRAEIERDFMNPILRKFWQGQCIRRIARNRLPRSGQDQAHGAAQDREQDGRSRHDKRQSKQLANAAAMLDCSQS